jgi:Ca-dependent carbohydrate-binding module xylan-binding
LYFNSAGLIVVATPDTRIFVSQNLSFHTRIVASPTSNELVPIVLGLTGSGQAALYAPFEGTLIAANRNLILGTGNGLTFTGSFHAKSIDLQPGSTLVCDAGVTLPAPATCSNLVIDPGETDVDCGGPACGACDVGDTCLVDTDCLSSSCQLNVCQAPVVCNPGTYPASGMFHSTGNAWWQGGWNLYSNGYISTNHNFSAGPSTVTVWSMGQEASGLPHMTVTVDGVAAQPVAGYFVNSGAFNPYAFTFTATAGTHEVRVIYDNDYFNGTYDRNLILRTVAVGCP